MLHFGRTPRYQANVKIIQFDVCAEELNNSVQSAVSIQADVGLACQALINELQAKRFTFSKTAPWWKLLQEKQEKNKATVAVS